MSDPDSVVSLRGEAIPEVNRTQLGQNMVENAAVIADATGDELVAYFTVGIDKDGYYQVGWRNQSSFLGPTLFSAFLKEIVTREIATQSEVKSFLEQAKLLD